MRKIKHLVVGAGLSGAVMAERIAGVLNEPVLVIDARGHIGGNCFDYRDKTAFAFINTDRIFSYLKRRGLALFVAFYQMASVFSESTGLH